MSYIANILQVETRQKFSKCSQGAPEWKKKSKFSKIFYFYPKLLKIAFGIIVSSSDNYGLEWVNIFGEKRSLILIQRQQASNYWGVQATEFWQTYKFCHSNAPESHTGGVAMDTHSSNYTPTPVFQPGDFIFPPNNISHLVQLDFYVWSFPLLYISLVTIRIN